MSDDEEQGDYMNFNQPVNKLSDRLKNIEATFDEFTSDDELREDEDSSGIDTHHDSQQDSKPIRLNSRPGTNNRPSYFNLPINPNNQPLSPVASNSVGSVVANRPFPNLRPIRPPFDKKISQPDITHNSVKNSPFMRGVNRPHSIPLASRPITPISNNPIGQGILSRPRYDAGNIRPLPLIRPNTPFHLRNPVNSGSFHIPPPNAKDEKEGINKFPIHREDLRPLNPPISRPQFSVLGAARHSFAASHQIIQGPKLHLPSASQKKEQFAEPTVGPVDESWDCIYEPPESDEELDDEGSKQVKNSPSTAPKIPLPWVPPSTMSNTLPKPSPKFGVTLPLDKNNFALPTRTFSGKHSSPAKEEFKEGSQEPPTFQTEKHDGNAEFKPPFLPPKPFSSPIRPTRAIRPNPNLSGPAPPPLFPPIISSVPLRSTFARPPKMEKAVDIGRTVSGSLSENNGFETITTEEGYEEFEEQNQFSASTWDGSLVNKPVHHDDARSNLPLKAVFPVRRDLPAIPNLPSIPNLPVRRDIPAIQNHPGSIKLPIKRDLPTPPSFNATSDQSTRPFLPARPGQHANGDSVANKVRPSHPLFAGRPKPNMLSLENGEPLPSLPLYVQLLQENYFHLISKEQVAQRLLQENMFLYHPSSSRSEENPLTLCLRFSDQNYKFTIRKREDGRFAIGDAVNDNEEKFDSIEDMVSYYSKYPLKFKGKQTCFGRAAPKHQ